MKDFLKKNKGKIGLFIAAAITYAIGSFLGLELPLADLFAGDVSALGEALEAGVEAMPAE